MKKIIYLFAAISLFFAASCVKEEPVSLEFTQGGLQMVPGDSLNLTSLLTIKNSVELPTITSSNEEVVAIVNSYTLLAKAAGEATITAELEGIKASCLVTVVEVKADSIVIKSPASMLVGAEWVSVTAKVLPSNYDPANLEWTFTPSSAEMGFESEKVSASEYKVRAKSYVKDAVVSVKVADKLSNVVQTAEIKLAIDGIKATKVSLDAPKRLTYAVKSDVVATLRATVLPEEYDVENLMWEFTPSTPDLKFSAEKVSGAEYKFSFLSYVPDSYITVMVEDGLSSVFNKVEIKALDRIAGGPEVLSITPGSLDLILAEGMESVALQVICQPEDYDPYLLRWSTSNEKVAVVDTDGVVTAVGLGTADIKLKDIVSGKETVCKITVSKAADPSVSIKRIELDQVSLGMRVGEESVQLKATCYDKDGKKVDNYPNLEWTADKMVGESGVEIDVVEVSQQGIVTPKNQGTTYVTVVDKKNRAVKALCNVSVERAFIPVKEVKFLLELQTLRIGETLQLSPSVAPTDADDQTLVYKSANESVAKVSATGEVTAVSKGLVEITATAKSGVVGKCRINVVKDIAFVDYEVNLLRGADKTLELKYFNDAIKNKPITWTSSDENVATVKNGKVSANNAGQATIRATIDGDYAECVIMVSTEPIEFDIELHFTDENIDTKGLVQDASTTIAAAYTKKATGESYYPANKSWKSSDPTVATVDDKGNVTAVLNHLDREGFANGKKVTITHIADGREKTIALTIVKVAPREIVFVDVPEKINHGDSYKFKFKVLPEKATQEVFLQGGVAEADIKLDHPDLTYIAKTVGYASFTVAVRGHTEVRRDFGVVVQAVPLQQLVMDRAEIQLAPGSKAPLTVSYVPENASYRDITWSSSDEYVAKVDSKGYVTAVADGTAVITAYQANSNKSATCTVTVAEPSYTYNIGDYYYSTGKVSSNPKEDAATYGQVLGVIFSIDDPTLQGDPNLGKNHPNATHGLVVSLEETKNVKWQDQNSSVSEWLVANKNYSGLTDTEHPYGYSNTLALKAYNAACTKENKVLAADCAPKVALPEKTSGWYLPSYAELSILVKANNSEHLGGGKFTGEISAKLQAAGGEPLSCEAQKTITSSNPQYNGQVDAVQYWSSTESDQSAAWAKHCYHNEANTNLWRDNKQKGKGYYNARYIFAF